MLRHNCLRNAQNIVATKETVSHRVIILKERRLSQQKYVVATEAKEAQDLQVATYDCIHATKTQNSVATILLDRDREGKSGP